MKQPRRQKKPPRKPAVQVQGFGKPKGTWKDRKPIPDKDPLDDMPRVIVVGGAWGPDDE